MQMWIYQCTWVYKFMQIYVQGLGRIIGHSQLIMRLLLSLTTRIKYQSNAGCSAIHRTQIPVSHKHLSSAYSQRLKTRGHIQLCLVCQPLGRSYHGDLPQIFTHIPGIPQTTSDLVLYECHRRFESSCRCDFVVCRIAELGVAETLSCSEIQTRFYGLSKVPLAKT